MKFVSPDQGILAALSSNIILESLVKIWEFIKPNASTFAQLGQVAVAIATVYYILRKSRSIGRDKNKKP